MKHDTVDLVYWENQFTITKLIKNGASNENSSCIKDLLINQYYYKLKSKELTHQLKAPVDIFVWSRGKPKLPYLSKIGGMPYRPNNIPWPQAEDGTPLKFLFQYCFVDSIHTISVKIPDLVMCVFIKDEESLWYCKKSDYKIEWWPTNLNETTKEEDFPKEITPYPEYSAQIFKTFHCPYSNEIFEKLTKFYFHTSTFQGCLISNYAYMKNMSVSECSGLICTFYPRIEAIEDISKLDGTNRDGWSFPKDLLELDFTIAVYLDVKGDFKLHATMD